MQKLLIGIFLISTILCSITIAQEIPSKLIDTEWLEKNLLRQDVRIVDVRDSVASYWSEHIPGAVYLSPDAIRWPDGGVPVKLIPPDILVSLLEKMGIDEDTLVIIYSEKGDFKPTYLLWALDYIGHKNSAILDGGFTKWKTDGKPITQDYPNIMPKVYASKIETREDVRAMIDEVKNVVFEGGSIIIDVRPVELYTGEKGNWKRKGHIKGAISHFWANDLNSDGTWKSKEELIKTYEKLGITPEKDIIVSCGQGQMSAHTYFTLKYILGYPKVRNYDGSFNEWSNNESLPIETGFVIK
ncbi:MAG: sulfurtransferase [bacterium]